MKALRVRFERDEAGWWIVTVPSVIGVRSQGRTIEEARRNVREALSAADDLGWDDAKAGAAEFDEEVDLTPGARTALAARAAAAAALQRAGEEIEAATALAVAELVGGMGLSYRDAASFLGISYTRVYQLHETRDLLAAGSVERYATKKDRRALSSRAPSASSVARGRKARRR